MCHVSVTDADRLPTMDRGIENETNTKKNASADPDTSFIQLTGTAYTENGKKLNGNNKPMAMLMKDSSLVMTALLPIDPNGHFTLRTLVFLRERKTNVPVEYCDFSDKKRKPSAGYLSGTSSQYSISIIPKRHVAITQ